MKGFRPRAFFALLTAMILLSLLSLLSLAFRPLAQAPEPSDLTAVLVWLAAGPGGIYVAGRASAFLFEKIPGWGTRVPEAVRPWIVLLAGIGLAIGAHFLLAQPAVIAAINPYYLILVGAAIAWLGSQQQFTSLKVRGLIERPLKTP